MKKLIYAFVTLSLISLTGCQTRNDNTALNPNTGVPKEQYLVGGGLQIVFTAPCEGTAIYFEKTSGKIIQTQSLKKGEKFDSPPFGDLPDEDSMKYFGVSVKAMKPLFYFVPSNKIETPSDEPCK